MAGDEVSRPLIEEGKAQMVREADALVRLGLVSDIVLTSPLARARQTAELVVAGLDARTTIDEDERLRPGFGPKRLRRILRDHAEVQRLLLVGHEPDLSKVIRKLTGGRIEITKGGLARVDVADEEYREGALMWLWQAGQLAGEAFAATTPAARAA